MCKESLEFIYDALTIVAASFLEQKDTAKSVTLCNKEMPKRIKNLKSLLQLKKRL